MTPAADPSRSTERTKILAFIACMGALGNILSYTSMRMAPIVPSVPLGPYSLSIALDLSHVATFIAALYGGPFAGGLAGLVGGSVAAIEFGFSKGTPIGAVIGSALPVGKALTGVFSGILLKSMGLPRRNRGRGVITLSAPVAYVPEAAYTAFVFLVVLPLLGMPSFVVVPIVVTILIKAFIELLIVGLLVSGLYGNKGFSLFMGRLMRATAAQGLPSGS